jgi:hypothetical protein
MVGHQVSEEEAATSKAGIRRWELRHPVPQLGDPTSRNQRGEQLLDHSKRNIGQLTESMEDDENDRDLRKTKAAYSNPEILAQR